MSACLKHSTVIGCWSKADNTKENVVIHYTYATNASGVEIIKATRYTTSDGTPIAIPVGETVSVGACSTAVASNKIPITARVYQSVVGAITVPANARREALLFNRSNRDILVTWTGTLGGGGTFTVPARGTYSLTLIEDPNEGLFATMVTSLDLYGTGALGANELLIDFKN
jgi:hypothetical protein